MEAWTILFTTILSVIYATAEKSNQGFKTVEPTSASFPYEIKFLPYYVPAKDKENLLQTVHKVQTPNGIPVDYLNLGEYALPLNQEYGRYNSVPHYRRTSSEIDIKNGVNANKNDHIPAENRGHDTTNNVTSKSSTTENDRGDAASVSSNSSYTNPGKEESLPGTNRRLILGPAPVVSLDNHSRHADDICRTYNNNLMNMWKMLVKFVAGGDQLPTPDVNALPQLFEMIKIYMELNNEPLVENERNELVDKATGILKHIRTAEKHDDEDAKTVLPIMAEILPPPSIPNGTDVSTWIRSKQTNSVDIMIPVPQSKCQEVALEGLMQTFKKLYQEYMIHIGDCQKQKKLN